LRTLSADVNHGALRKGAFVSKQVSKPSRARGVARLAVLFGLLLVLLGVGAYVGSEMESYTALIPSALGVLLVGCGVWGMKAAAGAYVALLLGALGAAAALSRLVPAINAGEFQFDLKYGAQATMALLSGVFVIAGVVAFLKGPKKKA
jgi:lysylphosphatidylglycerol synthetase-like protein (DUF2156 family)